MAREREATNSSPEQDGGADFGRYQLFRKLAVGGMAEVWLAKQRGLEGFEKLLVLKRILPHLSSDEEFVNMFLDEARIAARFTHPNIVQIYDLGRIDGSHFIAMEYVHGEDLGRVMRKAFNDQKWIPIPLALRVISQACEGLYYAHTKTDEAGRPLGVVHRDISPQNLLVSFDGSVKVVDFGIARSANSISQTRAGTIKGKYAYMSPEQAAGKIVDQRTDVFALGLVLYELLTCVRPLKRDSDIQTLQAALACEIQPPSEVAEIPDSLDALVMKALAKDVIHRFQNAREFQAAIEEYLVEQRMAASNFHLSEFLRGLFAERLEEERKSGRPAPSSFTESQQSMPAASGRANSAGEWVASSPGNERKQSSQSVRRTSSQASMRVPPRPEPSVAPEEEEEGDSTSLDADEAPAPRRNSGPQSQPRRQSQAQMQLPASRPAGQSRVRSRVAAMGADSMPDAPPAPERQAAWKVRDEPRPKPVANEPSPWVGRIVMGLVLTVGAGVAYSFKEPLLALLPHPSSANGDIPIVKPLDSRKTGYLSIDANLRVKVEVNGELVGETPLSDFAVAVGTAKIRLFSEPQALDRRFELQVEEGKSVARKESFVTGRVQARLPVNVEGDLWVDGARIGRVPGPPVVVGEGDHTFVVKNEAARLELTAKLRVQRDRTNFVEFARKRVEKEGDGEESP